MSDIQDPVTKLMAEISAEFPTFKTVRKDHSRLMRAIDFCLRVITLNLMRAFLTDFTTTVGYTIYVPGDWGTYSLLSRQVMLRHERVHMRQRRRVGMALFTFLYLLFPLPCGLAYYRMKFEREAYEESIMALAELAKDPNMVLKQAEKDLILSSFLGPQYFWAWPFKKTMSAWYDRTAAAAVARVALSRTPSRP